MTFNCAACKTYEVRQDCLVKVVIDVESRAVPHQSLFGVKLPLYGTGDGTVNLTVPVPAGGDALQRYESYHPVCGETDNLKDSSNPTEVRFSGS